MHLRGVTSTACNRREETVRIEESGEGKYETEEMRADRRERRYDGGERR
jgi:hypothetical protein